MNLENTGLKEIKECDLNLITGGVAVATVLAIIGAGIYVYNNWDDFVEGVKEGYSQN